MNRWLSIEFDSISQVKLFQISLNKSIINHSNSKYFKVFTPKNKESKHKIFYLADEGNLAVKTLEKDFLFKICDPPERKLITRVAGASNDRSWMI